MADSLVIGGLFVLICLSGLLAVPIHDLFCPKHGKWRRRDH